MSMVINQNSDRFSNDLYYEKINAILEKEGGLSAHDIAKRLNKSPSRICARLSEMTGLGLVTRKKAVRQQSTGTGLRLQYIYWVGKALDQAAESHHHEQLGLLNADDIAAANSVPKNEPPNTPLFALWSDGRLEIRVQDMAVMLDRPQVQQMLALLVGHPAQ